MKEKKARCRHYLIPIDENPIEIARLGRGSTVA